MALITALAAPLVAQSPRTTQAIDPFEHGWTLNAGSSRLGFATVKNDRIAENNRFATLSGRIEPDGQVRLAFPLELALDIDLGYVELEGMIVGYADL